MPVRVAGPSTAVVRAVPTISAVGRGVSVVGGRARTVIDRAPVVAATAAVGPGRGVRRAVTAAGGVRAPARIAAARVRRMAVGGAPAAGVGMLVAAVAAAAGLAGPTAVMVPARHGVASSSLNRASVALRPMAPTVTAAIIAGRPVPSVTAAATVPALVPAARRISAAAWHAVPATLAVAAAWAMVATAFRLAAGRRVSGARPLGGCLPRRAPLGGARGLAPPRVWRRRRRAAGGSRSHVVGRPDRAAARRVGPLRPATRGGRGSAPRCGRVYRGSPGVSGALAPVGATRATGRGR